MHVGVKLWSEGSRVSEVHVPRHVAMQRAHRRSVKFLHVCSGRRMFRPWTAALSHLSYPGACLHACTQPSRVVHRPAKTRDRNLITVVPVLHNAAPTMSCPSGSLCSYRGSCIQQLSTQTLGLRLSTNFIATLQRARSSTLRLCCSASQCIQHATCVGCANASLVLLVLTRLALCGAARSSNRRPDEMLILLQLHGHLLLHLVQARLHARQRGLHRLHLQHHATV